MKDIRLLGFALVAVVGLGLTGAGCNCGEGNGDPDGGEPITDGGGDPTDAGGNDPDAGGNDMDAGTDAGTPDLEFTYFVRDLILTQTNATNAPTTIDDKTFVDTAPADAFPASFFP